MNDQLTAPEAKPTDIRYTPTEVTRVLLDRLDWRDRRIYEPFAGRNHIADVLRERGRSVVTSDIDDTAPVDYPGMDFFGCWLRYISNPAIISNPPWSLSALAVRRALEITPYVAMLLRLTFQEPCDDRADLLRSPHLRRIIVLPRVSFHKGKRGTDNVPPAWFVFDEERGPCTWEVVTKRELAEAAGQGKLV